MTRPGPAHPPPFPDLPELLRQALAGLIQPAAALEHWLDRMEQRR